MQSEKRLLLGEIPKDFNKKRDQPIALSCFINHEDHPDIDDIIFPEDGISSREDLVFLERKHEKLISQFLPYYAEKFNKANGINRSIKFWEIMLMPWLSVMIENVLERKSRLDRFLDNSSSEKFHVKLQELEGNFKFEHTYEFILRGIHNSAIDEWVYSTLLKDRVPGAWSSEIAKFEDDNSNFERYQSPNYLDKIRSILSKCLRVKQVYGIKFVYSVILSIFLCFKRKCRRPFSIKEFPKIDVDFQLYDIDWRLLLDKSEPRSFYEIEKYKNESIGIRSGVVLHSGTMLYWEEKEKYELADLAEKGVQLVPVQHGGFYGTTSVFSMTHSIEYAKSQFISWGWKKQGKYSFEATPFCSPFINQIEKRFGQAKAKDQILLISATIVLNSPRIASLRQPNEQIKYRKNKAGFIRKLSSENYSRLVYRPGKKGKACLDDENYLIKEFEDLDIYRGGTLEQVMMESRISILAYPGTNFSLALALNRPILGVWPDEEWDCGDPARPYFNSLREEGILLDTFEQAAEFLNKSYDDIESWWFEPSRQKAIREWSHQFARYEENWLSSWIKGIFTRL